MDNSIVCDKCGKFIRYRGVYGYSHICSGHMKEINEHFNETITFASNQEKIRKAREVSNYDLKRAIVELYKSLNNL